MVSNTRKALLAFSALAATAVISAPAEAQWRHGGYHRGGYYGGYHHRGGGWGYGGAAAAGLVGGLALGALAAPAYGGGYGYGYAPAYGYGYSDCFIERQRVYDAWGRPIIRRVRVCN